MPKFIIERNVPSASKMTDEDIREASLRSLEALRQLGPEIQWIQSFVTDDKIYCIYDSPSVALIEEHAKCLGVPASSISEVRTMISPKTGQG